MSTGDAALGFFQTLRKIYDQYVLVGEQVRVLENRLKETQDQLARVIEQSRAEARDFHERLAKQEGLIGATFKDAAFQALKVRQDLAIRTASGDSVSSVVSALHRGDSASSALELDGK